MPVGAGRRMLGALHKPESKTQTQAAQHPRILRLTTLCVVTACNASNLNNKSELTVKLSMNLIGAPFLIFHFLLSFK